MTEESTSCSTHSVPSFKKVEEKTYILFGKEKGYQYDLKVFYLVIKQLLDIKTSVTKERECIAIGC